MKSLLSACLLVLAASSAGAEPENRWVSEAGHFSVAYTPTVNPVPLNSIHEWELDLDYADGSPVSDAVIEVTGGMPEHDHGMPTALRATAAGQPGLYLLEGVRFHMMGKWELVLSVETSQASDTVTITLML